MIILREEIKPAGQTFHRVPGFSPGGEEIRVLYYSNGGPGPATKLLRVDALADGDIAAWRSAPAQTWQPDSGWQPNDHAQNDILWLGEFFMIDASQVLDVQHEMLLRYEQFRAK